MMAGEWLFTQGGPVTWILFGLSVLALCIVLERCFHFLRMGKPSKDLDKTLKQISPDDDIQSKISQLRGPEAAVIHALFDAQKEGIADLARVATRVGSRELQRMERGLRALEMIGNVAPLLGLLGTIIGMIKAFIVIEQAGGKVDAQALAGGIWEAMITTGIGLAVAIPVFFLLHGLEGAAERRAHSMQYYASIILEKLTKNGETSMDLESEKIAHRRSLEDAA